jgi:hypothetical protein
MTECQKEWRKKYIASQECGRWGGKLYPWILPRRLWKESLWVGIRDTLPEYLQQNRVQEHRGVHNLKSSWVLCANLYFPFRQDKGLSLLAGFLKERVSPDVEAVEAVHLEYAEPSPLDPQTLLGEPEGGQRGANQTSPDVAFLVRTVKGEKGLVLTENKLVEHSFYPCSGRKPDVQNPDRRRCMDWQRLFSNLYSQCWQLQWEQGQRKNRRYWDYVRISEHGRHVLKRCPAATAGYQLFRQHALAEGIAVSRRYDLVASCVAYDARNDELTHCLRGSGVEDFTTGWSPLFNGLARVR